MIVLFLAIAFIILNILDVTTTNRILRDGGYEANPLVRFLMRINLFIPVKIIVVFIVVFTMFISKESDAIVLGIICCGIYCFIILNNIRTIRHQSKDKGA